jgi:hypothetical protein
MTQPHKILSLAAASLLMAATPSLVGGQGGAPVVITPGTPISCETEACSVT